MRLEILYRIARDTPSDINEHVPALRRLAEQCEHVTEFGVRYGVSTTALLAGSIYGKLQRLISCDIAGIISYNVGDMVKEFSEILWFIKRSSCNKPILPTDMLFVDTLHTRWQLHRELFLHYKNVRRWIVLHDTTLFGTNGERRRGQSERSEGLLPAIRDFLRENPHWFISEHYPNNSGLTILSCNPKDFYQSIVL